MKTDGPLCNPCGLWFSLPRISSYILNKVPPDVAAVPQGTEI